MTILFDQQTPDFDDSDELQGPDRAQPLVVKPCDDFVMLKQRDAGDPYTTHCILIERRDIELFIDAIQRSI